LIPGCEAKVQNEDATEAADGEVGTLWVKTPSKFLGYWQDGRLNDSATHHGWFCTGDQVRRDSDGFFYFAGRADDMLKVSGLWVSSSEVEAAAAEHAAVDRALVTVREDRAGVRRLVLYVVPNSGVELTPAALLRHLSNLIADYMLPSACVVLDTFPLGSNGKIQRGGLPDPYRADESNLMRGSMNIVNALRSQT
jgi:4-hydroxybenzoate-CoA ligase